MSALRSDACSLGLHWSCWQRRRRSCFALALGGGPHSPSSEDDARSESPPDGEGLESGSLPPVDGAGSSVVLDPPLLRARVRVEAVVDALAFVLGVRLADMPSPSQGHQMVEKYPLLSKAVSRH